MRECQPKYEGLLKKAGIERSELDESLQELIEKFEKAFDAIQHEEETKRSQLLKSLIGVDAIISARLYQLYSVLPERQDHSEKTVIKVDKTRVMALKAKALQLKWRNREGVKSVSV